MGRNARDKHARANRKTRSIRPEVDPGSDRSAPSKAKVEFNPVPLGYVASLPETGSGSDSGTITTSDGNSEDNGLGYSPEDRLAQILLSHLEYYYRKAISKIKELGYDSDVAEKAVFNHGYCYGGMDVLTNILHNSLAYLNDSSDESDEDEMQVSFTELKEVLEFSLICLINILQRNKPNLSRGDAMWCLLASELHVGRATAMEVPSLAQGETVAAGSSSLEGVDGAVVPERCRFNEGWGFGNKEFSGCSGSSSTEWILQQDMDVPSRFNLSPCMKASMKENIAAIAPMLHSNAAAADMEIGEPPFGSKEDLSSIMEKFKELNLESAGEDPKDAVILDLMKQIEDLEMQVKERKEWAQKKAMQAAQRVSNDLKELERLRRKKKETEKEKEEMKGKPTTEDPIMKKIAEKENTLRIISSRVDRTKGYIARLEDDNAEMRADIEALKLSAEESRAVKVEAEKKERKSLKKLAAQEKLRKKMKEEIAAEKLKGEDLRRILAQTIRKEKEIEAEIEKLQEEREEAMEQLKEEQRAKQEMEINNRRKLERLHLRIEIDCQKHKDDLQRLEQEYERFKRDPDSKESVSYMARREAALARLLEELDKRNGSSGNEEIHNRDCMICFEEEVSVVFLPCQHQVVCGRCNEELMRMKGEAGTRCPYCGSVVQERVRVFGAAA